jgi:hypothetical protein
MPKKPKAPKALTVREAIELLQKMPLDQQLVIQTTSQEEYEGLVWSAIDISIDDGMVVIDTVALEL